MTRRTLLSGGACGFSLLRPLAASSAAIQPAISTEAVKGNPDDPAIWIHPADPSRSLVFGTTKLASPDGAVVAFDLRGKIVQTISGIDRPNNIDVLGNTAAVTARNANTLWIFAIDPATGKLTDISGGGQAVFERPMGIGLYSRNGIHYAILSRKAGPSGSYLWQYRIDGIADGKARLTKVREFGAFSGTGEIEAIAVDRREGVLYYSDEGAGIRKYEAAPNANRELASFGRDGWQGDREGIAVAGDWILCTDQILGASRLHVFERKAPHRKLGSIGTPADSTDGIEATTAALGPAFPRGMLVMMNNSGNNFLYFRWEDVEKAVTALIAG